jgi:ligand-binding sensor domain-containing protein
MRVYRDDVDAISGASEYAAWGPILMPSDNVTCIHVSADGTQWIGTDKGVAKHTGHNTLEGWYVITKEDGLADDYIQAIDSDSRGNVYVGTRNGLSVFDGETWRSYNADSGLSGNNVLTVAIAKNDVVWIGTDNGVTSFRDGVYTIYR